MGRIFRRERDDGCAHGVGDRLAELWKEVLRSVPSFVGADDKRKARESIEQPKFE